MVQINFAQKQINAKIVYYGPGMSGKTTNLEVVHQRAPSNNRGELTSISTDGDRTLFFDYMPLDLGTIAGMKTCFQMYTVPGQVYYNSTRKLVLQGVDGVIFVADSSAKGMEQNLESLRNLEENLNEYGKSLATLPHVIQYNKRDLPDALPVAELEAALNQHGAQSFEAIASTGEGVFPTLKGLAAAVLKNIQNECGGGGGGAAAAAGLSRTGFHNAPSRPQLQLSSSGPQPRPAVTPRAPAPPAGAPAGAPAARPTSPTPGLKQTGFTPRTVTADASAHAAPSPAHLMKQPQAEPAQRPAAAQRPRTQSAASPAAPQKARPPQAAKPQARAKSASASQQGTRKRPAPAAPAVRAGAPGRGRMVAFAFAAAAVGAVLAKVVLGLF